MDMAKQKPSEYTREKLAGAHYLLDKMTENQDALSPFAFNFEAFLCLFRAITLIMQKELHCYPGFDKWYSKQREWMKKDPQMKLVLEMRNIALHHAPVNKKVVMNLHETVELKIDESTTITKLDEDGNVIEQFTTYSKADRTPITKDVEKPRVKLSWYFAETREIKKILNKFPNHDVNSIFETDIITICKTCLEKLEATILDYYK